MTELKRPERYVQFESIKPELKEVTEFYTRKVTDYQYRLKQLNEYADALENEISSLKEKPKEKLYFVKLPGTPSLDSYMCKSCSPGEFGYHKEYSSKEPNKISFSNRYDKKYSGGWQRQFTEAEIKEIDKRYWAFRKEVGI